MTTVKFPLGRVVATPGAVEVLSIIPGLLGQLLARHVTGDWGEMSAEDKAANDAALNPDEPGRLMSAYTVADMKLWVITEWDRSVTTFLLPEEY